MLLYVHHRILPISYLHESCAKTDLTQCLTYLRMKVQTHTTEPLTDDNKIYKKITTSTHKLFTSKKNIHILVHRHMLYNKEAKAHRTYHEIYIQNTLYED